MFETARGGFKLAEPLDVVLSRYADQDCEDAAAAAASSESLEAGSFHQETPAPDQLLDFGPLRVRIPSGAQLHSADETGDPRSVQLTVPSGRISLSVLATESEPLWPAMVEEIASARNNAGARVSAERGEWGEEVRARSNGELTLFVGVDGTNWMLYGVAAGPQERAEQLADSLRQILRSSVVRRGADQLPVRSALMLTEPERLVSEPMAPRRPLEDTQPWSFLPVQRHAAPTEADPARDNLESLWTDPAYGTDHTGDSIDAAEYATDDRVTEVEPATPTHGPGGVVGEPATTEAGTTATPTAAGQAEQIPTEPAASASTGAGSTGVDSADGTTTTKPAATKPAVHPELPLAGPTTGSPSVPRYRRSELAGVSLFRAVNAPTVRLRLKPTAHPGPVGPQSAPRRPWSALGGVAARPNWATKPAWLTNRSWLSKPSRPNRPATATASATSAATPLAHPARPGWLTKPRGLTKPSWLAKASRPSRPAWLGRPSWLHRPSWLPTEALPAGVAALVTAAVLLLGTASVLVIALDVKQNASASAASVAGPALPLATPGAVPSTEGGDAPEGALTQPLPDQAPVAVGPKADKPSTTPADKPGARPAAAQPGARHAEQPKSNQASHRSDTVSRQTGHTPAAAQNQRGSTTTRSGQHQSSSHSGTDSGRHSGRSSQNEERTTHDADSSEDESTAPGLIGTLTDTLDQTLLGGVG